MVSKTTSSRRTLVGCINFREGLNPGNLVTNDHYISKFFSNIKSFWKTGPQLHVAILNPPDFIDSKSRYFYYETVAHFNQGSGIKSGFGVRKYGIHNGKGRNHVFLVGVLQLLGYVERRNRRHGQTMAPEIKVCFYSYS